jgi:hypothetical protein
LTVGTSKFKIRNILLNERKAKQIKEQIKGDNLQEIATTFNKVVNSSKAVSLGSPVLPNIGRSSDLVSTLTYLDENKTYTGIEGHNGIFVVKILKKETPKALDNYSSLANIISNTFRSKNAKAYDAIKKIADIQDNRASLY